MPEEANTGGELTFMGTNLSWVNQGEGVKEREVGGGGDDVTVAVVCPGYIKTKESNTHIAEFYVKGKGCGVSTSEFRSCVKVEVAVLGFPS